ncbi:NAD-dependent epimerase/dehydratase family protein [Candidatus Pelagibacter ubique]|jgi:UDP-glucose 4-epimerase|nr:NAD-dependent epimerase/dehydratase family protein [Candidatus Pelagibacter ubique]
MKNKYIVITGGCGFIGSNLIKKLLLTKKNKIISIDDYSSGSRSNKVINNNVKYINSNTKNIKKTLQKYKDNIETLFHFGEFSRIHQSFGDIQKCLESNLCGTSEVFSFCLENKIRVIYSATSASLGTNGKDKYLSPYSLSKANNLELLQNLKKWFGLSYECLYFYNVYGNGQIKKGSMSTIIGIFERQFKNDQFLTVVKPGIQTRKFTHIEDTIEGCINAYNKKMNRHYALSNTKSYSILRVAKMFSKKIRFIKKRKGERGRSVNLKKINDIKIYSYPCKFDLKDYIQNFKRNLAKN